METIVADDIEFGKYIGLGAYGHIHNGHHRQWGPVSIRCLAENSHVNVELPPVSSQSVLEEAHHSIKLHHKNILQLMGIVVSTQTVKSIVYEPVPYGSLKSFLTLPKNQNLSDHVKLQFMYDVVLGMSYLNSFAPEIVHGDLNWNCVQVGEFFQLKISDFGLMEWRRCAMLLREDAGLKDSTTYEQTGLKQQTVSDLFSYATLCWSIVHQRAAEVTSRSNGPLAVLECCPHLHVWLQEWWHPVLKPGINFASIKNQLDPFVKQHAAKIEQAKIQLLTVNRIYTADFNFETDSADFSNQYPYYTANLDQQQQHQHQQIEKSEAVQDTGAVGINPYYNPQSVLYNGHVEKRIGEMKIHPNQDKSKHTFPTVQGNVTSWNEEGKNIHITGVPYVQIGKGNVLNIDSTAIGVPATIPKNKKTGKPAKRITVTCSKKKLDQQNMDMLAKNIGYDWKRLARKLKFEDGEIDTIDHDNHGLHEKIYQMLRQWVDKYDKEATLCEIADALIALKKAEIAAKIDDTYDSI